MSNLYISRPVENNSKKKQDLNQALEESTCGRKIIRCFGGVNSLEEVRGVGFVDFYGKTVKFMYFGYS